MERDKVRVAFLDVLEKTKNSTHLQSKVVIKEVVKKLAISSGDKEGERRILAAWHDLVCNGFVAWGSDLSNQDPPFCHLTERGQNTLVHQSRDPANPEGYMNAITKATCLSQTALDYVQEALHTYNNSCYKATAVMIGAAAESMIIDLRDTLEPLMRAAKKTVPKAMMGWQAKAMLNACAAELREVMARAITASRESGLVKLFEMFEANLGAFAHQLRAARNDAGHPGSISPVTPESVHANLLIFPELAKLICDLKSWVEKSYARAAR